MASARLSTFVGSGQFSARFHRTHYKDGDEAIEADYYDDDYEN